MLEQFDLLKPRTSIVGVLVHFFVVWKLCECEVHFEDMYLLSILFAYLLCQHQHEIRRATYSDHPLLGWSISHAPHVDDVAHASPFHQHIIHCRWHPIPLCGWCPNGKEAMGRLADSIRAACVTLANRPGQNVLIWGKLWSFSTHHHSSLCMVIARSAFLWNYSPIFSEVKVH